MSHLILRVHGPLPRARIIELTGLLNDHLSRNRIKTEPGTRRLDPDERGDGALLDQLIVTAVASVAAPLIVDAIRAIFQVDPKIRITLSSKKSVDGSDEQALDQVQTEIRKKVQSDRLD